MLSVPNLGTDRNASGSMLPYAAVTQRSGLSAASASRNAGSRAVRGHHTRSSGTAPDARASCSTGLGTGTALLPRPLGLPGCETTAATSNVASGARLAARSSSSTTAATSGVPKKTSCRFSVAAAAAAATARVAAVALAARAAAAKAPPEWCAAAARRRQRCRHCRDASAIAEVFKITTRLQWLLGIDATRGDLWQEARLDRARSKSICGIYMRLWTTLSC